MHVRVRRDADEQMVLAHVYHRLANLVSVVTVQIFKDDWSRPSAFQILGDTALLSKMEKPTAPLAPPGLLPISTGSGSLMGSASGPQVMHPQQFVAGYRFGVSSSLAPVDFGSNRPENIAPSGNLFPSPDGSRRVLPTATSSTVAQVGFAGERRTGSTTGTYWNMQGKALGLDSVYGSGISVSMPSSQQHSDKHK